MPNINDYIDARRELIDVNAYIGAYKKYLQDHNVAHAEVYAYSIAVATMRLQADKYPWLYEVAIAYALEGYNRIINNMLERYDV